MSANENLPLIYCTIQSPTYLYGNYIEIYRWYFRLPTGRFSLARPAFLNIRNLIWLNLLFNIRMELVFHTASRAFWSGPPLHIFKCLYPTVGRNLCPRLERFHYQLASCFPSTHPIASACLREEARGFHNWWYPKMDGL